MEILALSIAGLWTLWFWPILLFIIGLGLVVFVHELGHFLMAKFVGIKVERFALGFGPRLAGFHLGETDYCICTLPLGGYVKMLGQEDFKPLEDGQAPDPRSYQAKSVGARFAVIAAGVIMNVILSGVLFLIIGLVGKDFPAPVVGSTVPGKPAAEARIVWDHIAATQPARSPAEAVAAATVPELSNRLNGGDEILNIHGDSIVLWVIDDKITSFTDVAMTAALAKPDDVFTFTVRREVDGRPYTGTAEIGVQKDQTAGTLMFGIQPAVNTVFADPKDLITNSPFKSKDRLLAIAGLPVEHFWQIEDIQANLTGKAVTVNIQRSGEKVEIPVQPRLVAAKNVYWLKDGSTLRGQVVAEQEGQLEVRSADGSSRRVAIEQLTRTSLQILGMQPRQEILAVVEGSRADAAGLQVGDIILDYADRRMPTFEQFLEINEQVKGQGANITVLRDGKQVGPIWIVPKQRAETAQVGIIQANDQAHAVVAFVAAGSAAEQAGIRPGAQLLAVNDTPVTSWLDVCETLKGLVGQRIVFALKYGSREETAEIPRLDEAAFSPADYRYMLFAANVAFEPLTIKIRQPGVWTALKWGGRETVKLVLSTYASLRSIVAGYASTKGISGPVGIGGYAIEAGRKSIIDFVYFLGFISAAIAVFNFLPIPVVDGGHAVFLLIEKIRGKPVPVKVMNISQIVGLAMLGLLFLLVTWQDISRILRRLW